MRYDVLRRKAKEKAHNATGSTQRVRTAVAADYRSYFKLDCFVARPHYTSGAVMCSVQFRLLAVLVPADDDKQPLSGAAASDFRWLNTTHRWSEPKYYAVKLGMEVARLLNLLMHSR